MPREDIDVVPEIAGLGEESNEERKAAKKGFFPSSMGLSFLAPKAANRFVKSTLISPCTAAKTTNSFSRFRLASAFPPKLPESL